MGWESVLCVLCGDLFFETDAPANWRVVQSELRLGCCWPARGNGGANEGAAAGCGLALALCASGAAADDYEWPVARVIDGATLVVDAGADFPAELAMLTVRL